MIPVLNLFHTAPVSNRVGKGHTAHFDQDENQDLCLRIRKSGYEIGYIESAIVVHLGGQSERETPLSELWQKKTHAEFIFYRKHYLPTTVARIRRENLLKVYWGMATINLAMPFLKDRRKAEAKLIKYKVASEAMRQDLEEHKKG